MGKAGVQSQEPGPPDAGRLRIGCLVAAVVLLLVLLGAISAAALLDLWGADPGPQAGTDQEAPDRSRNATPTTAPEPPEAGCQDVTAQFGVYSRPRADSDQLSVLDSVELVCWEPTGELSAEAGYPADINADSPPMTWLCATLSDFLTNSGKDWRGFTVYSTHAASPGEPFLADWVSGEPCYNPQHQR